MSDQADTSNFLPSLQSKDHGELLNVIDLLRSQGISHYVQLPQLIVCGDQSSGKSSVLEAASGVRFPVKDNLCTRFATEVILRKDPMTSAKVAIIPGSERSDGEKKKLSDFKAPTVQIDELPTLINGATEAMGLASGTNFSDDVLRVEISGPKQPHLTLVDLPGLIHAENKQQSAKDVQLVRSLVRRYMANTRSIILAVVSAKNDYANQIVTKLARDVDPKGLRTLGIITKPDTLHAGSESENAFLDLAQNKDVVFRLGWHVLRNRDFDTRECTDEERDEKERDFFSNGAWMSLPTRILGIGSLKPRLSTVLKDQIISELPSLIHDVEAGITESRSTLTRLGDARETLAEQRLYLVHVSQSFSSLIKAAVDGVYVDDFFGDAMTNVGFSKRLRAVVQDVLLEFAKDMASRGHDQEIVDGTFAAENGSTPKQISKSDFLLDVRELMRRSRGCELPGTFNPLIVGDLFYQQSRPWKELLEKYSMRILDDTKTSLEMILMHTTDETTSEGLLREVIDPAMERYSKRLECKVAEIMQPHQKGHPITYNHYFTETIQKARQEHARADQARQLNLFFNLKAKKGSSYIDQHQGFETGKLLNALNQRTEADMDRYACSEAVDCMNAYYKVAMKVIVDNFAALAIENCLLDGLSGTFSPGTVMKLDDTLVSNIAAETEDSQEERARAVKKLDSLEAGLKTLNRFGRSKVADRLEEKLDQSDTDDQSNVDGSSGAMSVSDVEPSAGEESARGSESLRDQDDKTPVLEKIKPQAADSTRSPVFKNWKFNPPPAPPDDIEWGSFINKKTKKKMNKLNDEKPAQERVVGEAG